jgi:hypothetical protein
MFCNLCLPSMTLLSYSEALPRGLALGALLRGLALWPRTEALLRGLALGALLRGLA